MKTTGKFMGTVVRSMVLAAGVLGAPALGEAQLKPGLDEHIPVYQVSAPVSGKVSVMGSNTMKSILEKWQDRLKDLHPGLILSLQSGGSNTGAEAFFAGKVQVAAMSRKLTSEEHVRFTEKFGYPPIMVPVAVDALAVFVHKDNPLEQITLQELDAIFSAERRRGSTESLDRWGQLGVSGSWEKQPIHVHVRDAASGTHQFFMDLVAQGAGNKEIVVVEPGAASVVAAIMKDPYAIGYSGIGYRTSKVKPLRIASNAEAPFIEATFETATDGTYPLRRLLYLYVNQPASEKQSPAISEFVKFVISRSGQQDVVNAGFYPLPVRDLIELSAGWTEWTKSAAREASQPPPTN